MTLMKPKNISLQNLTNLFSTQFKFLCIMRNLKKLHKKILQTKKTIKKCIQNNLKNYKNMMKNLKKIWLMTLFACCLMGLCTGCNVTRTISNEATSITKGDTTIIIKTTTKEIYDATKKGATL